MIEANITPTTDIIASWRNQLYQWPTIFGELIDNAFDANAKQLKIALSRDMIVIEDNGIGCADLELMLTAGHHEKHSTTRLGRYGIGFKQAAASAGDGLIVASVHKGVKREAVLNWSHLEKAGKWSVAMPDPVATASRPGTTITISRLRNGDGISAKSIENLMQRLSEQYAPALKQGRQILFAARGGERMLRAPSLPELAYSKKVDFDIRGKRAELLIGLLPEGHSYSKSGLTVSYGFRVIEEGKRWGLGDEPTPGLIGFLDLLEGWNLSTNKERILDEDLEELGKQIAISCADVIDHAVKRGVSIPIQHLETQINALLRTAFFEQLNRREKRRHDQGHHGTRLPKSTGRRRHRATLTQPGRKLLWETAVGTGVKLSMVPLGTDGLLYHYQDGGIIELNTDNPVIAQIARQNPQQLIIYVGQALAEKMVLQDDNHQLEMFLENPSADMMERMSQLSNKLLWILQPIINQGAQAA